MLRLPQFIGETPYYYAETRFRSGVQPIPRFFRFMRKCLAGGRRAPHFCVTKPSNNILINTTGIQYPE
jgi:hypothetical protein